MQVESNRDASADNCGGHERNNASNGAAVHSIDANDGNDDSRSSSSSTCSINSDDSDVAFALMDFSGVDFGDYVVQKKAPMTTPLEKPESTNTEEEETITKTADEKQPTVNDDANVEVEVVVASNGEDCGDDKNKDDSYHDFLNHNPERFRLESRRVDNLIRWHELGVRPNIKSQSSKSKSAADARINADAHCEDGDLFEMKVDDLKLLLQRSLEAQAIMNLNLPPPPRADCEDALEIRTSTIPNAGKGLFTTQTISKGTIVCNYTGARHDYQSQKLIKDRAYVLKLQNGYPKHDRRNDGFVDARTTLAVLARYINDPQYDEKKVNVKFEHIQETGIWHCPVVAQRDIDAGEELFISYGPRYWSESRTIGG